MDFDLKVRIEEAIREVEEEGAEVKGVYAVIATRVTEIHEYDLIIDTDSEVLAFGKKLWNEPIYASWTQDRELYGCEGADILVKRVV